MNAVVTQEVSKYSATLRNRLGTITDFKGSFDAAFSGFVENSLPHDALYKQCEMLYGGNKKPSAAAEKPKKEENLLPPVDVSKADQIAAKMAKSTAAK